jgi:PAS domain S-box-containing protein
VVSQKPAGAVGSSGDPPERPVVASARDVPEVEVLRSRRAANDPIRVLLVEDDPRDAEALRDLLAQCRTTIFRVAEASRLSGALEALVRDGPDVVLLDLRLPDSEGLEGCERLVAEAPQVPVVVLTSLEDESLGVAAVQRGAQDFLAKGSADPEGVGRALRYAIERHAMIAALRRAAAEATAREASFRHVLERSIEALVVVDAQGVIRFANRSAAALFGRPVMALVGTPWSAVCPPAASDAASVAREVVVPRPAGPPAPAEIRTFDLEWKGKPARLASLIDLTDRRRAERLALARGVQRTFLPEHTEFQSRGLDVAAANELCEDVSGDFYDVFDLEDGRWVVAVGDVTGHGLGAALLMAQGRAALRAYCETTRADLREVLRRMNHALEATTCGGSFLTLFLAVVRPETGEVAWANAGGVPAHVVRASGRAERLDATSPPLWIAPGGDFPVGAPLRLEEGDVLFACSDGVTEATDAQGRRFGLARLAAEVEATRAESAARLVSSVRAALRGWSGGREVHDDVTLLALRRTATTPRPDPVSAPPAATYPPAPAR